MPPKLTKVQGLRFPSADGLGHPCPLALGVVPTTEAAPQLWEGLSRRGKHASPARPLSGSPSSPAQSQAWLSS